MKTLLVVVSMSIKNVLDSLEPKDYVGYLVAGVIGIALSFLSKVIVSWLSARRKKYCLSKSLVSSTVYQNREEDGLKIVVTYKGQEYVDPLSVLKIRLRNDGYEDFFFSQRCSRPLYMAIDGCSLIGATAESTMAGINPSAVLCEDNRMEITWDILKRDEFFYLKVFVTGEGVDVSRIKFDIRADGVDQIKTPEVRVRDFMIPVLVVVVIVTVPTIIFAPSSNTSGGILPLKFVLLISYAFTTLLFWVFALIERIKWLKEQ